MTIKFIVHTETHRRVKESTINNYAGKVGINWSIWSCRLESHRLFYKSNCLLVDWTLLFYSHSAFYLIKQILGRKKREQIFDKEQWDG